MEAEGLEKFNNPSRRMQFVHLFNKGEGGSGPILTVEMIVCEEPNGEDDCLLAYRWAGSGVATVKEFQRLTAHWRKREPLVANFIDRVVIN